MSETIWSRSGFPKVGIRPIIDGRRRGVRESLEVQTMEMAKTAAKLISSELRFKSMALVKNTEAAFSSTALSWLPS